MSVEATSAPMVHPHAISGAKSRSRFFQVFSAALLLVVLLGFARTFFLRPLFQVPPIPAYLYVHGAVLASWFALQFVQTSLIAADRTLLHRRLGIFGGLLALAVAGLGLAAVLGFPAHFRAGRVSTDAPIDAGSMPLIVCTDFASLALFSTFVATALSQRRRTAIHKRLMLLGSTAIIFPAAARTGGVFTQLLLSIRAVSVPTLILLNTSIQILIVFGLPLLIAVHDIRTERKLHPATSVGLSAYYLVMLGAILLASSAAGRALVHALE